MMWFPKRFRRENRDRDDPFQVLERMRVYFEEAKKELEGVSKSAPRQVLVIQRNVDLVKPVNLLAGFLILALGVGIGWWSGNPAADLESNVPMPVSYSVPEPRESAIEPTPMLPVIDSVALKDNAPQPSSSDTLLRKVNDLWERVKRGE